ncbi:hypothetical protein [Streptomyces sp. NPDC059460]|uniref:hypothetical protein n=1 Tax=Streptomyces sp. NPDC059460 TaxID=3346840 RepID=UPI0036C74481
MRADDVDFAKVSVVEDGHPTDRLKVCGDRYRKPYCMQRERVTVRDTDYELKRASTVYTLELTRADKRAMELRYRDRRSHEERDSVYGRARAGEPVTLLWWRGSVRMIQAGEGDDTATVRTGHYPGRLFSGPAALASTLCAVVQDTTSLCCTAGPAGCCDDGPQPRGTSSKWVWDRHGSKTTRRTGQRRTSRAWPARSTCEGLPGGLRLPYCPVPAVAACGTAVG